MEKSSMMMLRMANSNPLSGKKVKTPLTPNRPSSPKAQLGQAGASMAIRIPGDPKAAAIINCLLIKNMLKVITIPPSSEMITKTKKARGVKEVTIPMINENSKEKEKAFM